MIDLSKYLKPKKEEEEEKEKFNEIEFQKAYKEMATKLNLSLDPDDPKHFYDYRALYKETGKLEPDKTGHFPSKYKLEGHPSMVIGGINTKTGKPEEKKEKLGSQFGGGWGIADLVKETQKKGIDLSKYIIPKGEAKAGAGAKAEVSVKPGEAKKEEPDIFNALNESIEKNYKQYMSITKKLEAYEAEYNYAPDNIKPSIAANFNQLVKEQGDLVKQLQGDIGKRDQIINRYKHLEELWKMDLPVRPTEKIKEIAPGFKKVEDTELFTYKEPEKGIIARIKEKVSGIFKEKPLEGIAKAQNIVAISKETGLPIDTIEKDYEKMGRALGMRGIPTTSEYLSAMFVFPVTAAIVSNPISAGIGITKFLAMVEAENLIISKAKGWEYKFGAGKRLKDLTPDDTSQITKDIIDVVDFLAKGVIIRATDPGIKAMWQKFTKDVVKTHTPSQRIYLSGQKIRDLHKGDPKLATQLEKDVYTNLPKKAEAVRTAFKKGGIDVEVPVQTITKIADKPYWAKIKGLFNVKTYSETIVSDIKGKWTVHPAGFLPEPALGTKLYAGVPIDEMVKSIVAAGRLTQDIANQLKVMDPVDTGLVFQQLSMVSPAIASKIASQFVELIPQKITKIPKAGEGMTPEEAERFEKLKEAKIISKEEIEPTEAELKEIEKPLTAKEKFEEAFKVAKMKEAAEVKVKPGDIGEKFVGKAFRTETRIPEHGAEVIGKMKTAGEKLEYDYGTTGNYIFKEAGELAKSLGIDLNKVPVGEMVWVAKDFETAEKYDGAKELKLPEDTIILAKDDEGGFLVLKNTDKYTGKVPMEEPEKIEPEPTPEEIRKVFMEEENLETTVKNRELFYEKYNNAYVETKEGYNKLLEEKIKDLKEEGFKGVEKGGVKRDEEGYVIGKFGAVSKNPKWYRDFYERENKKPSNADLREIAKGQLLKGHLEDYGEVPANEIFIKLEAQLDSYEAILSDIKDGDYSFETPKNIEKLNEKLKEMEKENKKMVKDLKTEMATLKAEREAKYVGLKEEVEAGKKVEIEVGIKKGLKVAKAELKGRAIKGMPEKEIKEGNKLIQQIQMMVKDRGFTNKQFSDIKMTHGGARHLTGKTKRMTIPQLKAVLRAIEGARPHRIGWKKVITPKTEKKIQSLKDNLIDKLQMTEETYQAVLKDVGIYKEPKYVDAKHFITEQKGKELIYRLIDESNILRVTEPLRIALEKNPEAKKIADELDKRVKLEGKERLKDPSELNSMRKYIQIMQGMTDAPFFPIYQDLIDTHLENRADLNHLVTEFDEYRDIIKNEDALKRTESWILAKSNLRGVPKVSKDITNEEIILAKKIQSILKDYEAKARTEKFLDNIEHPEDMPQYNQYRKEINKAKDIYESKGYDDLVEYMETQEWGIIKNSYDPLQVVSSKVRLYKAKATTLGKTHIKVRKDIEYKEQDKNIIQRLLSYKRQMDNLSVMRPKIRAFVTLVDKNLDKFKDPNRIRTNIEVFFRELKGYDRPENWFDRGINRLYAQAMTTIIMGSPALSFRNLGQNFALGHDKLMLIDPRNKSLTSDEIDYLDTYVQQAEFMRVDWFMTGEKPLPGLKFLTDIIKKVNLYPRSDIANRHLGFWGKINQVKMAFDKDVSLAKKMEGAKFSDMTLLEQKRALEIFSKDGQGAMDKYVSRVYVDDTHFIYERAQRSPAEMGRMGRLLGNLMLFPRAYWEKLAQHSKKMTGKNVPFGERLRAFKVIASVLIGGFLVSAAYKKVTGRRKSPYDALELLGYEPGGLAVGTIQAVSDVYINMIMASKGDKRAMAALTTAIPEALDMFIPFYNYALRGIEAQTDTKNIDVLALRKMRMLIDHEYEVRGGAYVLERNAMERWQYFLGGAGIDVTIKEKKKEIKGKRTVKRIPIKRKSVKRSVKRP